MSSCETLDFLTAIEAGKSEHISNEELNRVFQAAVKLFSQRFQASDIDVPFANVADVTATDVAVTCSAMLDALNIQVFELGLWQSWQGHS